MSSKVRIIAAALVLTCLATPRAQARVSIIGGLTHEKQAALNETYEGSIIVKNKGDRTEEIRIYQTDYLYYFDGTNDYNQPGKLVRSNANWISFNPHRLTIPARSTAKIDYTVKVPDDPNLQGSYWSMIMIEEIPATSPLSSQPETAEFQVGIIQIVRYAIQMTTHINDTGERKLEFLQTQLLREGEQRVLQVDIENTGQRFLAPYLWVDLYDRTGRYIGRFDCDRKRIFPGASVRYKVDLTNVPEGDYKALVVADAGGDDIFGGNYNLKFE
jgi:hypothetical protein